MDRDKITPAKVTALRWIAAHEPVAMFPIDGPSSVIRKRLEMHGLIERCGTEPGRFGCIRYRVSESGRRVLSKEK